MQVIVLRNPNRGRKTPPPPAPPRIQARDPVEEPVKRKPGWPKGRPRKRADS